MFEIVEWVYAELVAIHQPASTVLGWQGDIWDAQKDMLMDGIGGLLAASFFYFRNRMTSVEGVKA